MEDSIFEDFGVGMDYPGNRCPEIGEINPDIFFNDPTDIKQEYPAGDDRLVNYFTTSSPSSLPDMENSALRCSDSVSPRLQSSIPTNFCFPPLLQITITPPTQPTPPLGYPAPQGSVPTPGRGRPAKIVRQSAEQSQAEYFGKSPSLSEPSREPEQFSFSGQAGNPLMTTNLGQSRDLGRSHAGELPAERAGMDAIWVGEGAGEKSVGPRKVGRPRGSRGGAGGRHGASGRAELTDPYRIAHVPFVKQEPEDSRESCSSSMGPCDAVNGKDAIRKLRRKESNRRAAEKYRLKQRASVEDVLVKYNKVVAENETFVSEILNLRQKLATYKEWIEQHRRHCSLAASHAPSSEWQDNEF